MLDDILEYFPEQNFVIATGYDRAIIGVDERSMRLIYSVKKCIKILMLHGLSYEDAVEHFSYNVSGAYIGEDGPIWCHDDLY